MIANNFRDIRFLHFYNISQLMSSLVISALRNINPVKQVQNDRIPPKKCKNFYSASHFLSKISMHFFLSSPSSVKSFSFNLDLLTPALRPSIPRIKATTL